MSDDGLLNALDDLGNLPPAAPAAAIATIARTLIGASRTIFFGPGKDGAIARNGFDDLGNPVTRPANSAADLRPFYTASDAGDGLTPLYDVETGPWVSIRLDAGTPHGALVAVGLPGPPEPDAVRAWQAFGSTLALRIAMTDQLIAVTRKAEIDPLTGAAMRTVAFAAVDARLRDGLPTTLIVIDLENFKAINDTHGHLAGDKILIRTANELKNACRDSDVVARFGGDEFIVVSDVSPTILADRLQRALEGASIAGSIGYATSPPETTRDGLFAAGDRSMYIQKAARKQQKADLGIPLPADRRGQPGPTPHEEN